MTAAQAQDRERVAKLEVQVSESDKRLATKEDVADVRSDIRVLRIWLFVGVLVLAFLDDINLIDVLLQLRRLGGGLTAEKRLSLHSGVSWTLPTGFSHE